MKKVDKIKTLKTSLIVFMLYFAWPYLINIITSNLNLTTNTTMYVKFFCNFILLFILVFIYHKTIKENIEDLKTNFKMQMITGLKIFLVGIGVYLLCNLVIASLNLFENYNLDVDTMYGIFKQNAILLLLLSTIYYPVVEEIVFKKTFKDLINNKYYFIIITGLLNAVFNIMLSVQDPRGYIYIIPNAIFSMCFSYIYYETDNLIVPITYRVLYNLIPNIVAVISTILIIF